MRVELHGNTLGGSEEKPAANNKKYVGGAGKNPGPRATRVDEGIGIKKNPYRQTPIKYSYITGNEWKNLEYLLLGRYQRKELI